MIVSAVGTLIACACVLCSIGDEEVDEQIRLRDDIIFQLKQQMGIQQQRIADLEHIIVNELSQISIKKEGISINCTSSSHCLLVQCILCIMCVCL